MPTSLNQELEHNFQLLNIAFLTFLCYRQTTYHHINFYKQLDSAVE